MFDSLSSYPPRREHPELLDFLRFALATLVIFSHSYALLHGNDDTEPLWIWSRGQLSWGGLAVDGFFALSGYLITLSFQRSRSVFDYLRKRVLRIYPGFIVAALVAVFVIAPLGSEGRWQVAPLAFVLETLRLREYAPEGVFPHNPLPGALNGSLWSISYEFWCYVGIALLGVCKLLDARRVLSLLLASIALSIVFVVLELNPGGSYFGALFGHPPLWARLLPYYLAGSTFYLWRERIPMTWPLLLVALVALIAGALIPVWGVAATYPVALTYVLLFVAFFSIPVLRSWAKYGDFSYGIYLYAFPIQQLIVHVEPELTPVTLFALSTPLTFVAAAFSWYVVEKPFIKLKKKPLGPPALGAKQPAGA